VCSSDLISIALYYTYLTTLETQYTTAQTLMD
jgi:hypothetical protein